MDRIRGIKPKASPLAKLAVDKHERHSRWIDDALRVPRYRAIYFGGRLHLIEDIGNDDE